MKPLKTIIRYSGAFLLLQSGPCLAAADQNTSYGQGAAADISTGTNNSFFGYSAGNSVTSGSSNLMLGEDGNITTGNSNILIGNSLTKTTATTNDQLDIADLIFGAIGSAEVGINQSSPGATLDVNGGFRLDGSSSGYVEFQSPATPTSSVTYTLPSADAAAAGYVLSSNGSGTLSWIANGSGGTIDVDVQLATGTASAPPLSFFADTITGLYQPSSGNLAITTAGTEAVLVDNSRNLSLKRNNANLNLSTGGTYQIGGTGVLLLPDNDTTSIALGDSALASQSASSSDNTAIGASALTAATSASHNTAAGYSAGEAIISGTDNSFFGYKAGSSVTGSHNIILGEDPSGAITSGNSNILLGNSLTKVTNSSSNQIDIGDVIVVTGSGTPSTSTTTIEGNLTALGNVNLSTSDYQIGGNTVLALPNSSVTNIAVGVSALAAATADENTAVGHQSLQNMTSGTKNTAIGKNAMMGSSASPLTGTDNTAVGHSALASIQGGAADNTAVGYFAGDSVTTGTDNTLLGFSAGSSVTGSYNVIVGEVGNISTGNSNVLLGNNLANVTDTSNNQLDIADLVFGSIGSAQVGINQPTPGATLDVNGSFRLDGSGSGYVAFQSPAAPTSSVTYTLPSEDAPTSGYVLSSNGSGTLSWIANGSGGTIDVTVELASGTASAPPLSFYADTLTGIYSAGSHSINFTSDGTEIASFDLSGDFTNKGSINPSGAYEIGSTTILSFPDSDTTSVAVGASTLSSQDATSSANTAVGDLALHSTTSGTYNTAVGYEALESSSTATNTAVGYRALYQVTDSRNTAVGYVAGDSATAATDNTLFGYAAGSAVTGSYNIILGEDPDGAITSGSNNILIGNTLADVTSIDSDQIDIGDVIVVTGATPGDTSDSSTTIEGSLTVNSTVTANDDVTIEGTLEADGDIYFTDLDDGYACIFDGIVYGDADPCDGDDDARKQNLVDITTTAALSDLMKLEPVEYSLNPKKTKHPNPNATTSRYGFSTDQVAGTDSKLVAYQRDMKTARSWRQASMIALLVKVAQEEHLENGELQRQLSDLSAQLSQLKEELEDVKAQIH